MFGLESGVDIARLLLVQNPYFSRRGYCGCRAVWKRVLTRVIRITALATETRASARLYPLEARACSGRMCVQRIGQVFLTVHVLSSPSPSLNPSNQTLSFDVSGLFSIPTNNQSSTTSPWHTKCSTMSTSPSFSNRRRCSAPCSGRMRCCGHACARLDIGARSCEAGSIFALRAYGIFRVRLIFFTLVFPLCFQDSKWATGR